MSGTAFCASTAVVKLPELTSAPTLMPNCFSTVRCTSATVTFSMTCSSPSILRRLITNLVAPPQAVAAVGATCDWVWACAAKPVLAEPETFVERIKPGTAGPVLAATAPLAATIWQAMSSARFESIGVRTVPLSTAALPAISTWIFDPGT